MTIDLIYNKGAFSCPICNIETDGEKIFLVDHMEKLHTKKELANMILDIITAQAILNDKPFRFLNKRI